MTKDPLDRETSLSAEITATSVRASAKSRTIAAVDRLLGSLADWGAARVEGATSKQRSVDAAETKLIDAVSRLAIEHLKADPELAERAIQGHLNKIVRTQSNKEAVVTAALEDLRRSPPTEAQSEDGVVELSEEVVDRLGHYAEDANTGQLRERWGRVLASEVRKPGTFSQKALRVIDEMDAEVAKLFEEFCSHRIQGVVPKCIYRTLSFSEEIALEGAGLLVDPTPGQHRVAKRAKLKSGLEVWMLYFYEYAAGISTAVDLPKISRDSKVNTIEVLVEDGAGMPVYVLTDVGQAIASIIDDKQEVALVTLAKAMAKQFAPTEIFAFKAERETYVQIGVFTDAQGS